VYYADEDSAQWVQASGGGTAGISGTGQFVNRTYVGDGVLADYTVSTGATVESLIVTENGIVQTPTDDYTVSGSTLTFTTAPANNVLIQIREMTGGSTPKTFVFLADDDQTTFAGLDEGGRTMAYTPGGIQVHYNGFLLMPTVDYTATNGTSVVLQQAAAANDVVVVTSFVALGAVATESINARIAGYSLVFGS
jgi:hypothetical protein